MDIEQRNYLNINKKIKHFLIDIEEPVNHMNVKQFQEIAQKSIQEKLKNNLPFLVGKRLVHELDNKRVFHILISSTKSFERTIRRNWSRRTNGNFKKLRSKITKKINFADQIRTIRALEVFYGQETFINSKIQQPPTGNT